MNLPSREELEQAFYNDGRQLASGITSSGSSNTDVINAVKEMYVMLDLFLDSFLENAASSDDPPDCKKGCSYCCHQAVFAQEYEFRYLKNWMFTEMDAEEIEAVRERAKHKKKDTEYLSHESRLRYKAPCPLLKDGICSAYQARPVACRIYISRDLPSCVSDFYQRSDSHDFPRLFDLPLVLGRKMNEGFSDTLKEKGFSTDEFRMEEGLLR